MARYTRRIKYVRKAPRKRWSPYQNRFIDIRGISSQVVEIQNNLVVCWGKIIDNAVENATPTPTVIKAGNFKVTADASYALNPNTTIGSTCYIVFVPERWVEASYNAQTYGTKLAQIPISHPEWIIAQGNLQSETASGGTGQMLLNSPAKSFSSRLKRNLQTGDSIYYLWVTEAASTNGTSGSQIGTVTYHTNIRAFTTTS